MDVGAGHPFCGESLQQRVSAVQHTPSSATRPSRSRTDSLGQQYPGGRESHSRHQFHLMLATWRRRRPSVKSQGGSQPGSRIRNIECGSWSARDSWTRRFRQRLSHFLQGPGAQAMAFFACALPRPCSSGRPIRAGAPPTCVNDSTTSTPSAQLASVTLLVRVSQQQQQQQHTHDDSTRLSTTHPGTTHD